jgi:DNA-binding protein (histone)
MRYMHQFIQGTTMATLSDLNRKIAKLQQQANAIKNKERKGIISQIRQAIVDYDLTFEDLFSADGSVVRQGRRPGSGRQVSKISDGINKPRRGRPVGSKSHKPVPIRYRDNEGNTWTGRGKQPKWLRHLIEAGHDISEFKVNEES